MIKEKMGDAAEAPQEIGDVENLESLKQYDGLIVGSPTWNTGADEERSGTAWDNKLGSIKRMDLGGKPVACFGVGDSANYGDYYCDALEEIYSIFSNAKGKMVGKWAYSEGEYEHTYSKAEIEPGVFCGLALDQDNQDDLTPARVDKWVAQIRQEMGV
ncbi:flavodoxin IsiB [Dunaliella salina]|uniref:Flavodoxin IsiB n=1 Tax=Dunaliella salina TaxID=3046 RepID=A0ABQ7G1S3_DUNSA|nr:flavodoxin IsiB [Dunaliella salina]|eukprot:KAF5828561.1 flavodoxin IsiB [Dunaliella salina]